MMLADSTAWIWSRRRAYPELRQWFDERLEADEIATCDQVRLELLAGVHSPDYDRRARDLDALDTCLITPRECQRAMEVQARLARLSTDNHKGVRPADLLIAAAAEAAGVEVLHYDAHFERIQEVTQQPMRWLAPKGTLR
ncbi:MAG: PIN domain-containing protein [Thermoleophilia bacterium]|nr:PIN domain-containing protein [Thermoleophilia bacterium]